MTTVTMTVTGFERLGTLVVRPRTFNDSMFLIPAYQDRFINRALAEAGIAGVDAGDQLRYNALVVAIAQAVIVEPVGFVDQLLTSTNSEDFQFFGKFAEEYSAWLDQQVEDAQAKKSGTVATTDGGKKSASSSAIATDSSQLTLDG